MQTDTGADTETNVNRHRWRDIGTNADKMQTQRGKLPI